MKPPAKFGKKAVTALMRRASEILDQLERERDALRAELSALRERNAALEAELAKARERQRWIPVGERMPEEWTDVMVKVAGSRDVYPRHLCWNPDARAWEDEWGHVFDGKDAHSTVTHWMPLPAPPKEGA